MAETSSELLMKGFQDRLDAAAFEQIVGRFTRPALAAAVQLLHDPSLAEDAVQESFLRVVRGRRGYRASKPFSAWFYAILRNVCTDMLRRRARQAKLTARLTHRRRPAPHELWAGLDVPELLAILPEADRVALTLRVTHDLTFRDIAAVLGISEEAVKKRAQRALRRLRTDARVRRWCGDWCGAEPEAPADLTKGEVVPRSTA